MPSTHLSLHYHLVFSTKNRLPMITKDWRVNLHAYLGGIVNGIKGVPLAIGGIEDHVHLLVGLRATHRLDNVLRTSRRIRLPGFMTSWAEGSFEWQAGYLGVTVSPSQIERVKNYVLNQEEHHRRQSFQKEYFETARLKCADESMRPFFPDQRAIES